MKRDIELEANPWLRSYAVVAPVLDERSRRRWAAAESLAIGYGGDAVVSSATGLARETIRKGRREIARDEAPKGSHETLLCGGPGGFQVLAEQRMARLTTGCGGSTIGARDTGEALNAVIADRPGWEGLGDLVARRPRSRTRSRRTR